jgi:cyclophilin family peptidyl-prolyl cis-trans isomerase
VDLITKGFYNKMVISRSDGFVVQFGDPEPQGDKHGCVPQSGV